MFSHHFYFFFISKHLHSGVVSTAFPRTRAFHHRQARRSYREGQRPARPDIAAACNLLTMITDMRGGVLTMITDMLGAAGSLQRRLRADEPRGASGRRAELGLAGQASIY